MRKFFMLMLGLYSQLLLPATIEGRLEASKGGLEDYSSMVVYLKTNKSEKNKAPQSFVMKQVDKSFSPHVLAIQTGDKVEFPNKDDIFHNVFSLDPKNSFDLGFFKLEKRYSDDKETVLEGRPEKVFKRQSKVQVFCNIHQNMKATVFVFSHPYFTKVQKQGTFKLELPPGQENYTLVLDGDRINAPKEFVVKKGSEPLKLNFTPNEKRSVGDHKNKHGKSYGKEWSLDEDEFY